MKTKYNYFIYISGMGKNTIYRQTLDKSKMQFYSCGSWSDGVNATFLLKPISEKEAKDFLK